MGECKHENVEKITIESEDYPEDHPDRYMLQCLDCGATEDEWSGGRGIPEFTKVRSDGVPA